MAGALVPTFIIFPTWGVAASVIALWAALVAASIVADYRRVAAVWLGAAALFPVADLWVETTQYVARNAHADYRIVAAPYNPDARVLLVAGQPASRHDADARGWEYAEVIETILCEAGETRVLVLGAAGMTLGKGAPCDLSLTYVDIDPAQERIAAEFLQTERPGALIAADARAFLRTDASEPWPAIVVDTFSNAKIVPDHLLTVEFYRLLRSRLAPGGSLYVNHVAYPDDLLFLGRADRTLRAVFASCATRAVVDGPPRSWNGAGHRAPQPPLSLPEERSRRRHGHLFRRGTQGRPGPRVAMTDEWRSLTHRFAIGGHHGYIIVATDEHDRPLLLEIRMAKAGGVLRGLLDALATSVSLGLQKGVPLASYVDQLQFARFEPSGWTDSELGYAHSIVDYIARWLGLRFAAAGAIDQPAAAIQGETCAVCAAAVTWEAGAPCPECGNIGPSA